MKSEATILEYLTTTRIGDKGQLTVPKQFREELGLTTGSPFTVLRLGDGLILLPEQQRFEALSQKIASILRNAGITPEDIQETLPATRQRLYERRYKSGGSGVAASLPVSKV